MTTFDEEQVEQEPTGAENPDGASTETENQDASTETENQDETQTETEGSEVEAKPVNQEAVNRKINKVIAKQKQAEAEAEAVKKELEKYRAKLAEKEKSAIDVEIPSLPDAWDPEYQAKVAERDRLLQEKAKAEAAAEVQRQRQEELTKQQQEKEREKYIEQTQKMYSAGEKVGIKKEELQKAEQTLALFVKDPSLAQFILAHDDSALIVNHLAANVEELDKISAMPSVNASAHIVSKVLPEAQKFKPTASKAPDPLSIPSGKAAGTDDPFLKGVQFE
jgi:hypothetical protein